ncbi:MAG: GNAT family N-acetyltransferase [Labilibaculum sp.]|nr:GNAT family N-acetyltransferase [Labilibaculum sp.]MBI9058488.1 GNAT family N-acetyltransferase [Labilibaculum sp.]
MASITSLKNENPDAVYEAFAQAFNDYEIQLSKEEFFRMMSRRGFDPSLSFAAYENDKIVAFTLNGIGEFNGIKTAYDTGTGTIKEYRGKGLASEIFKYSIPYLKSSGIEQYLLEVLQHNEKAVSIYKKLGFEMSREFNYFVKDNSELKFGTKQLNQGYQVIDIDLNNTISMLEFCDFNPSWQNSFEAISRNPLDFKAIGITDSERLIGYCIFEPNSGDISQIAVDRTHRRKGVGSHLLSQVLKNNKHNSIKIINTDVSCTSITNFLKANTIEPIGKQFEMIKKL